MLYLNGDRKLQGQNKGLAKLMKLQQRDYDIKTEASFLCV